MNLSMTAAGSEWGDLFVKGLKGLERTPEHRAFGGQQASANSFRRVGHGKKSYKTLYTWSLIAKDPKIASPKISF
jgi:hypothetical protein